MRSLTNEYLDNTKSFLEKNLAGNDNAVPRIRPSKHGVAVTETVEARALAVVLNFVPNYSRLSAFSNYLKVSVQSHNGVLRLQLRDLITILLLNTCRVNNVREDDKGSERRGGALSRRRAKVWKL